MSSLAPPWLHSLVHFRFARFIALDGWAHIFIDTLSTSAPYIFTFKPIPLSFKYIYSVCFYWLWFLFSPTTSLLSAPYFSATPALSCCNSNPPLAPNHFLSLDPRVICYHISISILNRPNLLQILSILISPSTSRFKFFFSFLTYISLQAYAVRLAFQYSCLLSSSPYLSHFFFSNLFLE